MDSQAGFLISQIKQIGGRVFEKVLAQKGINEFNGAQGKILYVLWEKDNISIAELSQMVGLANTTLTSMLDRMEVAGLLSRLPDPRDRRKSLIALTDKARGLKDDYDQVSQQMNDIYFRDFSSEEVMELEHYLKRVLNNIKQV